MVEANEQVMWIIIASVLGVILAVSVFTWVSSIQKDTFLEKNYFSRDLSLLIDTIYAAPGNVEYTYSHKTVKISDFNFLFKTQRLVVTDTGKNDPTGIFYWYADNKMESSIIDGFLQGPKEIKMCGVLGNVSVVTAGKSGCSALGTLKCADINTKLQRKPKIMLDPVFGGMETGKTPVGAASTTYKESEIARNIAVSLYNLNKASGAFEIEFPVDDLRTGMNSGTKISIDDRVKLLQTEDYDALIIISVGEELTGTNPVKVFVNKAATNSADRKMACMIANSLMQSSLDVTSISPPISKKDPLLGLKPGAVAIEVQLGNIENYKADVISEYDKTAKAIYKALKDYYEIN